MRTGQEKMHFFPGSMFFGQKISPRFNLILSAPAFPKIRYDITVDELFAICYRNQTKKNYVVLLNGNYDQISKCELAHI